jgi:hypothetical protein
VLLIVFMFTPLSRKLDSRGKADSEEAVGVEAPPGEDQSGSHE